jgi:hypothetical protein
LISIDIENINQDNPGINEKNKSTKNDDEEVYYKELLDLIFGKNKTIDLFKNLFYKMEREIQ